MLRFGTLAGLLFLPTVVVADTLRLKNGQTLEGIIQTNAEGQILIDLWVNGVRITKKFNPEEVAGYEFKPFTPPGAKPPPGTKSPPAGPKTKGPTAAPSKTAAPAPQGTGASPKGPSYFLVPLQGMVGKEVVARKLKDALTAGLTDPKTILVLEIDSPGGLISECEKIIALLAEQKERRSIAFIRNAYSAAAMIALTCDGIYLDQNAAIGSATAVFFKAAPPPEKQQDGGAFPPRPPEGEQTKTQKDAPAGPAQVTMTEAPEKLQSVWRSVCRRAAEMGGHEPLLAEAMADPEVQLRLVVKDGKKSVEQFLTPDEEDVRQNRIIKNRGKLLTLTATEAVNCGLAAGVAKDLAGIGAASPELAGWKPVNNRGERIMTLYRNEVKKAEDQIKSLVTKAEREMRLAVENDPSRSPPQAWAARCKKCYEHLRNCEQALQRISEIGTAFPFLEADAKAAQEQKTEIQSMRRSLKRYAAEGR